MAKRMRWLSYRTVLAKARKSAKAALECSIKHWTQIATATPDELIEAIEAGKTCVFAESCALCVRQHNDGTCIRCPIFKKYGYCTDSPFPWTRARNAFDAIQKISQCYVLHRSEANKEQVKKLQKAAKEMVMKLEALR